MVLYSFTIASVYPVYNIKKKNFTLERLEILGNKQN